MNEYRAGTEGKGLRVAVIGSRYNDFVTAPLVDGAVQCLRENGVAEDDIHVFWCPGALELPALAARVVKHGVQSRYFDAVVCAGCVIRGETDHYTFVSGEAVGGIATLALEAQVAVGNAVLTVENTQQAVERAGAGEMNKGREAALAALEMANLFRMLK